MTSFVLRSYTPLKFFPEPIGQLTGQVAIPSSYSIPSNRTNVSFASRSILLIKVKIGMNMKRTANKFQRAYMVAKARVQEVESQQEAIEKKFIADKGIVNPDGSVPEFLYCMEDDAAFEKANDECAALIVSAGLEEELNAARSVLKASEDSLIAYGLSLAPAGVRATLEKAVQHNAATRAKVLDLAFRLDVSTVSA